MHLVLCSIASSCRSQSICSVAYNKGMPTISTAKGYQDFPVPLSCESIKPISPVTMGCDSLSAMKDAGGYHRVVISTHCRWAYV